MTRAQQTDLRELSAVSRQLLTALRREVDTTAQARMALQIDGEARLLGYCDTLDTIRWRRARGDTPEQAIAWCEDEADRRLKALTGKERKVCGET